MFAFLEMVLNLIYTPIYDLLLNLGYDLTDINISIGFGSITWFDLSLDFIISFFIISLFTFLIVRIVYNTIRKMFSRIMEVFL